ncbi:hypothetical protein COOONC_08478 [Cooperia oncophora]
MKVELIVLLFACFLTQAEITTIPSPEQKNHSEGNYTKHRYKALRGSVMQDSGQTGSDSDTTGVPTDEDNPILNGYLDDDDDTTIESPGPAPTEPKPRDHVTGEPDVHHNVFMIYKIKNASETFLFNLRRKLHEGKVMMQELFHHPVDPEEEDDVETSTGANATTEDYGRAEVFLDGRESLQRPCSLEHMSYIERNQIAGCSGAVQFATDLCEVFFECLRPKKTRFEVCEQKVCTEYSRFSPPPDCVKKLFSCSQ